MTRSRTLSSWLVIAFVQFALLCDSAGAIDYSAPGPYSVGTRTVTVTRTAGATFTARLSYPAASEGANTPFAVGAAPAPAISFGHGFLQPVSRYATTLDHLASWGFVVIASNSGGELFPDHAAFAADLSRCLTWLTEQNASSGAFLEGKIDTASYGLSGHSMGGGASILAAAGAASSVATCVANLAAANTTPSSITAMANVRIPISLICGDADTVVPVSANGQAMYNAGAAPRLLPVIRGGFHCGFEDVTSFGCDTGNGATTRTEQLAITRRLLTQFFLLYLRHDQSHWNAVWGPQSTTDPKVVLTKDPGITLSPGTQTITGAVGAPASGSIVITNTGPVASTFDMRAEEAAGTVTFAPSTTALLATGQSTVVNFSTTVPAGGGGFLLTARRGVDQATRSFANVTIKASAACPADFNGDGFITGADYDLYVQAYEAGEISADFDADGFVTGADFDAYVQTYEKGC